MRTSRTLIFFVMLAGMSRVGHALTPKASALATSSAIVNPVQAQLLVALMNVPAGTKGTINLTPRSFIFASSGMTARLAIDRISAVFVGDERAETGGVAGKVARVAIPYGGGAVLGTVTQKQVGLLTLDYRDERDGLRSAVFVLPRTEALAIADEVELPLMIHPHEISPTACNPKDISPSIRVLPIEVLPGLTVPPEYRALLYEHLLEVPAEELRVGRIVPYGERSAGCTKYALTLIVEDFSKGNAALRASTGPVGLFLGATKLAVRVQLRDSGSRVVLDKVVRASRRGDSESLNAASSEVDGIAKQIKRMNIREIDARLEQ